MSDVIKLEINKLVYLAGDMSVAMIGKIIELKYEVSFNGLGCKVSWGTGMNVSWESADDLILLPDNLQLKQSSIKSTPLSLGELQIYPRKVYLANDRLHSDMVIGIDPMTRHKGDVFEMLTHEDVDGCSSEEFLFLIPLPSKFTIAQVISSWKSFSDIFGELDV